MWQLGLAMLVVAGCGRFHFDALGEGGDAGAMVADAGGGSGADASTPGGGVFSLAGVTPMTSVSTSTAMATFADPATAGNTIVVALWLYTQTPPSIPDSAVTDSEGNMYTRAVAATTQGTCGIGRGAAAIFYAPNVPASAAPITVTVAPGGASPEIGLVALEYAGIDPAQAIESVTSDETSGGVSPFSFGTGTLTTTVPDTLLVSVGNTCAGLPDMASWTDTAGFRIVAAQAITNGRQPGIVGERIVTAAGTYADTWTYTFPNNSTGPGIGVLAAFH